MDDVVIAHTVRGERLDCVHFGSVVVVNRRGDVLFHAGNIHKKVYDRSLPKPYKAVGVVECGAADRFAFGSVQLALIAGSHSGSKAQVSKLKEMLRTLNLPISSLKCGAELPLGPDAIAELVSERNVLSALHCDCSGEHIGNLAICLHRGWPIDEYEHASHPVQHYLRAIVEDFIEYTTDAYTIDGCGLPTYYVPLFNLAKGMANLCGLSMYAESSERVINAIIRKSTYFAGDVGRYDTNLIRASEGSIISKCGAEGLYAVGWPRKGIGLAIKVADGNHRAAIPVITSIIERLDLAPATLMPKIHDETVEDICTNNGLVVGHVLSLV